MNELPRIDLQSGKDVRVINSITSVVKPTHHRYFHLHEWHSHVG